MLSRGGVRRAPSDVIGRVVFVVVALFVAQVGAASIGLSQMAAMRPRFREPMERTIIVSFVYTYLPLDAQKLDRFEAFLTRPATRRFNRTVAEGLGRGLGKSIASWALALAEIFANREQQI